MKSVKWMYFYIHFVTEVCCFYMLSQIFGDTLSLWLLPLMYDFLAFVPQRIIGVYLDKHPKFSPALVGVVLMIIGILAFGLLQGPWVGVALTAIGNAFIHVNGAKVTMGTCQGKMTPAAVFVAGGSFGVFTGKLLAFSLKSPYLLLIAVLSMVPYILLCEKIYDTEKKCVFSFHDERRNEFVVLALMVFVVAVRSFIGYAIPTSWNKTTFQMVLLYTFMGLGKALGGVLIDHIGMRKTIYISVMVAVPFLIFGDKIMILSLIGVMFFSMTMPITLGIIASVYKNRNGAAFGLTTIGLFLGVVPIFLTKFNDYFFSCILILISSFLVFFALLYSAKKVGSE